MRLTVPSFVIPLFAFAFFALVMSPLAYHAATHQRAVQSSGDSLATVAFAFRPLFQGLGAAEPPPERAPPNQIAQNQATRQQ